MRSSEFEASTTSVDVLVTARVFAYFSCPTTTKTSILAVFRSRSSRVSAIVEEFQFDFGIELGLEQGEKSDVVSQRLEQRFSSPSALRIRPTSK